MTEWVRDGQSELQRSFASKKVSWPPIDAQSSPLPRKLSSPVDSYQNIYVIMYQQLWLSFKKAKMVGWTIWKSLFCPQKKEKLAEEGKF